MEVQGQVLARKIILCGVSRLNFGGPRNVSEIGSTFQMWKPHLLLMKQKGLYTHHTSQKKDTGDKVGWNHSRQLSRQVCIPRLLPLSPDKIFTGHKDRHL